MFKKNNKIILALAAVGFFLSAYILLVFSLGYINKENEAGSISIRKNVFRVEVVSTPEKLKLGLGERSEICQKCGMLFVFPEKTRHSFWMKGMRFPLDILWIENEVVVAIEKNIPHDTKEVFSPNVSADKILEINAGKVDLLGIELGDKVTFE